MTESHPSEHTHEAPNVSAEDVKERLEAADTNVGTAQGEADPGVDPNAEREDRSNRPGGIGENEDAADAVTGRRPLPGDDK